MSKIKEVIYITYATYIYFKKKLSKVMCIATTRKSL